MQSNKEMSKTSVFSYHSFLYVFASSLAITIVSIFVILAIISSRYNNQLLSKIKEEHQVYAQSISREIRLSFDQVQIKAETIAATLNSLVISSPEIQRLLNSIIADAPYYSVIRVADSDGNILAGSEPMDIVTDLSAYPGLKIILSGRTYYSDIRFDNQNRPYLEFAIPIKNLGDTVGFVYTEITLKRLWWWFDNLELPILSNLTIIDNKSKRVISDTHKSMIGKILDKKEVIDSNLFKNHSLPYVHIKNEKLISLYEVEGYPLLVVLESSTTTFSEQLKRNYGVLASIAALILAVATILAYFLAEQSSRPLRRITSFLEIFPSNRKIRFKEELTGEYKILVNSINQMGDELKRQEEALIEQESLATIGRTVSVIAHELRHGFHLILNIFYDLESEKSESINLTRKIIDDLNNKTNNLLEYSRAGKLDISKVKVNDILSKSIESCFNYQIEVHKCKNNMIITVDEDKIILVITNLIRNAIEAGEGQSKVILSAKCSNSDVEFTVSDNGPGIPEEIKEKIFDPFFTTKSGGFGIGLSFVSAVVKAHSGHLSVSREADNWTVFKIILPFDEQKEL